LSHASNHFYSGYFGDTVSLFAQPSLDWEPSCFCFLLQQGWQVCATIPNLFHWVRGLTYFLHGLTSNCDPPDFSLVARIRDMQFHTCFLCWGKSFMFTEP
jgi:hypothetical protein